MSLNQAVGKNGGQSLVNGTGGGVRAPSARGHRQAKKMNSNNATVLPTATS